jgi:hypothetical protein
VLWCHGGGIWGLVGSCLPGLSSAWVWVWFSHLGSGSHAAGSAFSFSLSPVVSLSMISFAVVLSLSFFVLSCPSHPFALPLLFNVVVTESLNSSPLTQLIPFCLILLHQTNPVLIYRHAKNKRKFDAFVQEYLKTIPMDPEFCLSRCTGGKKAVCVSFSPSFWSVLFVFDFVFELECR